MDDYTVRMAFRHMFAEERILRLRNFDVKRTENTVPRTLYIHVNGHTEIERITNYTSLILPIVNTHCFDLVTLSEVMHDFERPHSLIGT